MNKFAECLPRAFVFWCYFTVVYAAELFSGFEGIASRLWKLVLGEGYRDEWFPCVAVGISVGLVVLALRIFGIFSERLLPFAENGFEVLESLTNRLAIVTVVLLIYAIVGLTERAWSRLLACALGSLISQFAIAIVGRGWIQKCTGDSPELCRLIGIAGTVASAIGAICFGR